MSSPSLTVLIIEDFVPDQELYRRYLLADVNCNYSLLAADNATTGLELCGSQVIDGILLDYFLPDQDGLAFLKSLNAQSQGKSPPVVMVTGKGDEVIAVQAIRLGATDYLVKQELTPERLQLSMRSAIENARLRQQVESNGKLAQQQLRESEERLQLGVQVAGVALAKVNYVENRVELSPEAAALYGFPAHERTVTRERIHEALHPEERAVLMQLIQQALDPTGAGWFVHEHRVVCPDGEVRWVSVRQQVYFDQSREPPQPNYGILAAIDITAQKQTELERTQLLAEAEMARADAEAARIEAEAANHSKDEFVTIVAHELRSPLTSILGWARVLQNQQPDAETKDKALATIVHNTYAQVQLVEDLLDMSRMVRGTFQLTLAPVNLVSVIEAALDIVRPTAEAKQIRIETHLTVTPDIWGDFNRLQQVVVNLLTNAIKFTPDQGNINVVLEQANDQVQLLIHDTGKGIAPERLPRIFERFQQGQTVGVKEGLGLGLAIVKHLVELHRGSVVAESPGVGQGTTFTVQLPQLDAAAAPIDADNTAMMDDATRLAGVRVLVVDDEPDMLDLIQFVLTKCAAQVKAIASPAAALDCLPQFKPDLLVSDLAMPELNGYELVQKMRLLPEGQIPAIILTAYENNVYQEKASQVGVQQYLTKPIDPDDLIAAIVQLVQSQRE